MAIGPTVTKISANKFWSLCKLIRNSMHVNLGYTNDGIAMKSKHDRLECVIIIIIMIIIIIIMSVFYSANFNSDKSPCSKALMISDRHQTEAGRKHTI